uniref:Uncharacterized protein n=1 Tax=Opuntia streptacantha TaxID=393608 RepID=A0A7C9AXX4_OPUST
MEKIICPWIGRKCLTPIMISSNEPAIINHRQSVSTVGRHHIHNPNRIFDQNCCQTSIQCIHIHDIPNLVSSKGRKQLLVVLNPGLPLTVVMLEGIGTSARNIRKPIWCNLQPLRPL